MSEPEIDALMAGQEDENGSVHYEGEHTFFPSYSLFHFLSFLDHKLNFFLYEGNINSQVHKFIYLFIYFSKLAEYA